MGVSPLDRRSEQLNQGSSSPFHLADKIYGNEELLLTSGVSPPSFRVPGQIGPLARGRQRHGCEPMSPPVHPHARALTRIET